MHTSKMIKKTHQYRTKYNITEKNNVYALSKVANAEYLVWEGVLSCDRTLYLENNFWMSFFNNLHKQYYHGQFLFLKNVVLYPVSPV